MDLPVCRYFLQGGCYRGDECRYRHVRKVLTIADTFHIPQYPMLKLQDKRFNILVFEKDFRNKNRYNQLPIRPSHVLEAWTFMVKATLGHEPDEFHERMIDQVHSPAANQILGNVPSTDYSKSSYRITEQPKHNRTIEDVCIMSDMGRNNFRIPRLDFQALSSISYLEFCKSVRALNSVKIDQKTVEEMFRGVIHNVFGFRSMAEKTAAELQMGSIEAQTFWENINKPKSSCASTRETARENLQEAAPEDNPDLINKVGVTSGGKGGKRKHENREHERATDRYGQPPGESTPAAIPPLKFEYSHPQTYETLSNTESTALLYFVDLKGQVEKDINRIPEYIRSPSLAPGYVLGMDEMTQAEEGVEADDTEMVKNVQAALPDLVGNTPPTTPAPAPPHVQTLDRPAFPADLMASLLRPMYTLGDHPVQNSPQDPGPPPTDQTTANTESTPQIPGDHTASLSQLQKMKNIIRRMQSLDEVDGELYEMLRETTMAVRKRLDKIAVAEK